MNKNNMNKNNMKEEILQLGRDVLKNIAKSVLYAHEMLGEEFINAVELINSTKGKVIFCGIGKSGIIAKKIAATLSSVGTPSFFLHPVEALHGDIGIVEEEDIVIVLSHSGETEEILMFLKTLKNLHLNNKVIAITAKSTTSITKMADIVLLTYVHKEITRTENRFYFIPTTSTSVMLAIGDALASASQQIKGFKIEEFLKRHPKGSLGKLSTIHTVKPAP